MVGCWWFRDVTELILFLATFSQCTENYPLSSYDIIPDSINSSYQLSRHRKHPRLLLIVPLREIKISLPQGLFLGFDCERQLHYQQHELK